MRISYIKSVARKKIKGNWGIIIGAYIVMSILVGCASFTYIGPIIIGGPLMIGFTTIVLSVVRSKQAEFGQLFSKFNYFGNTFVWYLLYNIYIMLWSMLFFIPGIIKTYSYAMSPYILADNPEMEGNQAITESRQMMDGHKAELFLLDLSFIGWLILSVFTFGILLIWVIPYMQAARAEFYIRLKGEHVASISNDTEPTQPQSEANEFSSNEQTEKEIEAFQEGFNNTSDK